VQEDEDLSLQVDDDDDQAAVAEAVAAAGTVPYMLQGLLSATKKKRTLTALYEKNPDTGMISRLEDEKEESRAKSSRTTDNPTASSSSNPRTPSLYDRT
jgi:hypothetical protein